MSGVTAMANAGSQPISAGTQASVQAPALGQADFLRLMTAQMTSQDPFKPMDSTQMVAQMAQFSQVAGIAEMNQSLKTLVSRSATGTGQQIAGWIGRSAMVDSNRIAALPDGSMRGEIDLAQPVENVTLVLSDAQGQEIRRVDLGPAGPGTLPFAFAAGPEGGPLTIRTLVGGSAAPAGATTRVWTTIDGVHEPSGPAPELQTPIGAISPAAVRRLA